MTRTTGRKLNGSAALLAFSVLADSAVEHYRGSFQNRAMYTPLIAAAATLGASLFGLGDPRAQKHTMRDVVYGSAAATGFTGLGFHLYNILKRPGQATFTNLFYGAPVGAPAALVLAGALGKAADTLGEGRERIGPIDLHSGRGLGALAGIGILGSAGEAALPV